MKLENIKLSNLKPLEHNVRKHNDKQIDELIRSVEQFGQTRAIVIDEDNNILIGNGLYMALQKMGREEVQCFRKTGLTEIQKKKLVLTDNKVYSLGSDDYEEINNFINDITITGDYDIAGFDEFILQSMTMTEKENEDMMKDYGRITDIKLTQPEPTPAPVINTPQPQVANDNASRETVTIVTETEVPLQKTERRYVICSSCGEVIYID